jgi:hypothetical protein
MLTSNDQVWGGGGGGKRRKNTGGMDIEKM